jgi:serine/threonine protein kinase
MNIKLKEWSKIPVKKEQSFSNSKRYSVLEKLGEGAFGFVMKAKDAVSGSFVALKSVPLKHVYADERSIIYENEQMGIKRGSELIPNHIFREIKSLQHLSGHPNIIRYTSNL